MSTALLNRATQDTDAHRQIDGHTTAAVALRSLEWCNATFVVTTPATPRHATPRRRSVVVVVVVYATAELTVHQERTVNIVWA